MLSIETSPNQYLNKFVLAFELQKQLEPGNLVLTVFAYARKCTSHTKPPSKMHYTHHVYLY
jgi:hypothetical protein